MSTMEVTQITRELILTAVLLSMPIVGVSLIVGLIVSLFQTLTSIQEQTLTFAPRILAVAGIIVLTLPWMLKTIMGFTYRMIWHMAGVGS